MPVIWTVALPWPRRVGFAMALIMQGVWAMNVYSIFEKYQFFFFDFFSVI